MVKRRGANRFADTPDPFMDDDPDAPAGYQVEEAPDPVKDEGDPLEVGEALKLYFRDIRDTEPLTKEEEIALARDMKAQWQAILRLLARQVEVAVGPNSSGGQHEDRRQRHPNCRLP